jgi:hypothetical protein
MTEQDITAAITPRGRPFEKGNPGKPKPTGLKSVSRASKLLANNAKGIVETVIKLAKEGDVAAARLALSLSMPKDRVVTFPMLPIKSQADVVAALDGLMQATSQGLLTPGESSALAAVIEKLGKALESSELESRLLKLERLTAR